MVSNIVQKRLDCGVFYAIIQVFKKRHCFLVQVLKDSIDYRPDALVYIVLLHFKLFRNDRINSTLQVFQCFLVFQPELQRKRAVIKTSHIRPCTYLQQKTLNLVSQPCYLTDSLRKQVYQVFDADSSFMKPFQGIHTPLIIRLINQFSFLLVSHNSSFLTNASIIQPFLNYVNLNHSKIL